MPAPIDEFDLIRRFFAPLAERLPGAAGLTDDAAVVRLDPGTELVVSADTIVAGVHFPTDARPEDIARRALRVNLSDVAAKGAVPFAYTMCLQLDDAVDVAWLEAFSGGLAGDQEAFEIGLLGGDTTRTPGPLAVSITMYGRTGQGHTIRRSGAQPGDLVYVTGTIGDAALGLAIVQDRLAVADEQHRAHLLARYTRPEPRTAVGPGLVGVASASADVSDGLAADLAHICDASGVRAEISLAAVPISAAARAAVTNNQPLRLSLLGGGDDYEIVFTAPESAGGGLLAVARSTGVELTCIGQIRAQDDREKSVVVRDEDGEQVDFGDGGFRHFGQKDGE